MALKWSCESVAADFRDLQATSMAVDRTGTWAMLAGRKAIAIVDLDQPLATIKRLPRMSKYEAGPAEWHPMHEKQNIFATTFNDKLEFMQYHDGEIISDGIIKAHTRTISGLNWSPFDCNLLATCSVDSYACIWDTRDTRRPTHYFHSVAGATQVKWNKFRDNILASSHDGDLRIWDHRKDTMPVEYITGHLNKINGLEWSHIEAQKYHLVTCSQDCTVKFWDAANPNRATAVVTCNHPVWRARFTPFGGGLLTVVVPQVRRGENSLILWNAGTLRSPVHTFVGHNDAVREFDWRQLGDDYELVTWSRDQTLRIWTIDSQLKKLCGREEPEDLDVIAAVGIEAMEMDGACGRISKNASRVMDSTSRGEPFDHSTAPLLMFEEEDDTKFGAAYESEKTEDAESRQSKSETISGVQPRSLQQEFHLLNRNIPNVCVEEMNIKERTCVVSANSGKYIVRIMLRFPASYPFNSPPSIHFYKGSAISTHIKTELSKVLKRTCQQHVKKNLSCLEPCLRQLISTLVTFDKETVEVGSPFTLDIPSSFVPPKVYSSYKDANVPFPRTSGATFCVAGFLVCHKRPSNMKNSQNSSDLTPRSLSALIAYADKRMQSDPTTPSFAMIYPPVAQSPTGDPSVSISSFYYQDRKQRARGKLRRDEARKKSCSIEIYEVSKLCPVSRELAEVYVLDDYDILLTCTKNMSAAAAAGRRDLLQVWSLASLLASSALGCSHNPNWMIPWAFHPFGRKMLESLIQYHINIGDIQTVAMLCCTFTSKPCSQPVPKRTRVIPETVVSTHLLGKWWLKSGGSPYHTIHNGDTMEGNSLGALLKSNRSNSWSDYLDDCNSRHFNPLTPADPKEVEKEKRERNSRLLDPNQNVRYDEYKRAYAEILFGWGLLEPRTLVLKHLSSLPEAHRGIEFINECYHCKRDSRGRQCIHCKRYSLRCIICNVVVKGLFSFCMLCGHGGHSFHLIKWFMNESICPTGCGCDCLLADITEYE